MFGFFEKVPDSQTVVSTETTQNTAQKDNILIKALDYDGCLSNYNLVQKSKRRARPLPVSEIINEHKAFLDNIKEESRAYKKTIICCASLRQSALIDFQNWFFIDEYNRSYTRGSCYHVFVKLVDYLKEGGYAIELDKTLLTDLTADRAYGSTFDAALALFKEEENEDSTEDLKNARSKYISAIFNEHPIQLENEDKIFLYLFLIHKYSNEYKDCNVRLEFWDDLFMHHYDDDPGGLFKPIKNFFDNHPYFIPPNLKIPLWGYHAHPNTSELESIWRDELTGAPTNLIDTNYKRTLMQDFLKEVNRLMPDGLIRTKKEDILRGFCNRLRLPRPTYEEKCSPDTVLSVNKLSQFIIDKNKLTSYREHENQQMQSAAISSESSLTDLNRIGEMDNEANYRMGGFSK